LIEKKTRKFVTYFGFILLEFVRDVIICVMWPIVAVELLTLGTALHPRDRNIRRCRCRITKMVIISN
jgi:hypothetical protein